VPTYIIERQYLLPVFQHMAIDAPDVASACAEALDEEKHGWEIADRQDEPKTDYDNARATEITRISRSQRAIGRATRRCPSCCMRQGCPSCRSPLISRGIATLLPCVLTAAVRRPMTTGRTRAFAHAR
jgi:hypothetical protein